jgi:hypothetical protein
LRALSIFKLQNRYIAETLISRKSNLTQNEGIRVHMQKTIYQSLEAGTWSMEYNKHVVRYTDLVPNPWQGIASIITVYGHLWTSLLLPLLSSLCVP